MIIYDVTVFRFILFDPRGVGEGGLPGNSWLGGCVARFSKSWPYFRLKSTVFHTRFKIWGPFLQSPDNFSGAKLNIQIEIKGIRARVMASKIIFLLFH